MATIAQLEALTKYAGSCRASEAAEKRLLAELAASADTRRSLDAAVATADDIAAEALRLQLSKLAGRAAKEQQILDKARAAIAAARIAALAGGTGVDLLSGRHPLLLLPVRLEARFAWLDAGRVTFDANPALEHVLLVRVYPDEIHEDSHDPQLTAREMDALTDFLKKLPAALDQQPLQSAWTELAARVGATRAGWIGELAISQQNPGIRPGQFSRPSVARLMPDCWFASVELEDGSTISATSAPVIEPLETGPTPGGMAWMTDFKIAETAGMALIIRNLPAGVARVQHLRVIGVRGTLNPSESQAQLQDVLRAHQFTRGFELVAPGTPTNSLPGARVSYTSRPAPADVVEVNQRRYLVGGAANPLCRPGDDTDGTVLATMLGLEVATFGFVKGADATNGEDGMLVRSLLAAATERTLVRQLDEAVSPDTVRDVLAFGVRSVSAQGSLPVVRVGPQPYGILPVLRRDATRMADGSSASRFLPMLDRLRPSWEAATAAVDRVGKAGADPDQTLIRILQQDGVAKRLAFRPFIGNVLARAATAGLAASQAADLEARRNAARGRLRALGIDASSKSPLIQALHLPIAPALARSLIEPVDAPAGSVQRAVNHLALAAAMRVDELFRHDYPGGERPLALLFAIARLAVLEQADARARELLVTFGADPARWDDEDLPSLFNDQYASMQRRLESPDPIDPLASIAFHLSEMGRDAFVLAPIRATLRTLKTRPPELLDQMLRASVCLFSSRLDAWYTALATDELAALRGDRATATGIGFGAYGVLDQVVQSPRRAVPGTPGLFTNPTNGGYVHAPSVNQGAAAAVLRSAHLAHSAAGHGEAFSVDLSSSRVRRGVELSEGIRSGQPLAALLGYQVERDLRGEQLARFIAPLRRIAPLVANKLTPSALPAESVAASNVIDGLTLLAEAGYDGQQPSSVSTLWSRHPALGAALQQPELSAFGRVLAAAQDAVDAVSDLAMAESVYQAVQGNPVRAGATMDSLSGAPVPPADFSILRAPRSGVGVTHRLMVLLGDGPSDGFGWHNTPRALAEPRIESWARSVLPRPAQIMLRARFVDADLVEVARLEDVTLANLLRRSEIAMPHLSLGALDVVALADPHEIPHRSALEVRIAALLDPLRPTEAADAALELIFERGAAWDHNVFGLVEALEIAKGVRDLISKARPLAAEDFVRAGITPAAAVNTAELAARAGAAAARLSEVESALSAATQSSDLRRALFTAESIGVAGAAPSSVRDPADAKGRANDLTQLLRQVAAVLTEVNRRKAALAGTAVHDFTAQLKAVFGDGFRVLPVLMPPGAIVDAFQSGRAPNGGDESAARAWLARAARVREAVRALDEVLGSAEAVVETLEQAGRQHLHVAQIGGAPGERWIALPLATDTSTPGGRVSLVAVTPGISLPSAHVAGLLVDEWVEVVPSTSETTSVSFHYDAPTSTPPQVMLLGVPYRNQETWSVADVLEIVDEALALGKIRLVDMDMLTELGQFLPAFVTPENEAGEIAGLDIESLTRPETV